MGEVVAWEQIVVEPSGAVPLAAVLTDEMRCRWPHLHRIGIIVSGGNADLAAKGLWETWLKKP
jgi:threonine dehydratase